MICGTWVETGCEHQITCADCCTCQKHCKCPKCRTCNGTGYVRGQPIMYETNSAAEREDAWRMATRVCPDCRKSRLESPQETISRLERELAAAIQMRDRFFEAIPETFGEVFAVHPEIEKLCEPHEWDNRTTPENAAWSLLQACDLVTELEVAEQERDRLRAALEAVEWKGNSEFPHGVSCAFLCGGHRSIGEEPAVPHAPDCQLGIALDRPECRKEAHETESA